jgi:uncharacterized membrane protein YvlD (DUF360 family)
MRMTLPLTILTLGLFLLVVNAISISLVAYLTNGFDFAPFVSNPSAIKHSFLILPPSLGGNPRGAGGENV